MPSALPSGVSPRQFATALKAFERAVGKDWVLTSDEDLIPYGDAYGLAAPGEHAPSAAVSPATVEAVQAVVRLAGQHRVPLWPISRGKNYGYGGAAPRMSGTVILDLGRMRRILEVNVERGYCLLEPGVGFYDLYDHLIAEKIPLWVSSPGNAVGSVVGNALEHGLGYTTAGDRAANVCGMEVVLPNGDLVRTGMGAMAGNGAWNLYKFSYGPSFDQMFMQSNLGIVTKMGCWLMPEPDAALELKIEAPNEEDIGWIVEALAPLKMTGVIPTPINIGNFMRVAMAATQRDQWRRGQGAVPEEVLPEIRKKFGLGWWGVGIMLYGDPEVLRAQGALVRRAFAKYTAQPLEETWWRRGEPRPPGPTHGVPISFPLQIANWAGPNGGHLGFSPILPPERNVILEQLRRSRALFREHGFDYYGGFTLGDRHVNQVNMLAYAKDDPDMVRRAKALFEALMKDARSRGFGEYRSHLSYMDEVADSYDFNGHALRRLAETVKDALDPQGILAPGKQGVWPKRFRGRRS